MLGSLRGFSRPLPLVRHRLRWGCLRHGWARTFFPSVDSGQFKIHVRARTGTRIEETAALCDHIDSTIREQIPAKEIVTILDNIGLPYSGLNLSYSTFGAHRPGRRDIQVSVDRGSPSHRGVCRAPARRAGPSISGVTFYVCRWTSSPQIPQLRPAPRPIRYQSSDLTLYGNAPWAAEVEGFG